MANINTAAERVLPQAGADNEGRKIGFLDSVTKVTASDTITVTNATTVHWVNITDDTAGDTDPATLATNVITLTGSATGTVSGIIYYN